MAREWLRKNANTFMTESEIMVWKRAACAYVRCVGFCAARLLCVTYAPALGCWSSGCARICVKQVTLMLRVHGLVFRRRRERARTTSIHTRHLAKLRSGPARCRRRCRLSTSPSWYPICAHLPDWMIASDFYVSCCKEKYIK